MGQEKEVFVEKLILRDKTSNVMTIDERIHFIQDDKRKIMAEVLNDEDLLKGFDSVNNKNINPGLTLDDVKRLFNNI